MPKTILRLCSLVLTKNNEGTESKEEDEEQQDTHSDGFPCGLSWPIHFSRQAKSYPQCVVAWSDQFLQPPGQPSL